ncbi:MAG TPA: PAS domain S-box protein [Candidatus Dormibacteraeota bacterium]|nr:PAS domain S-box protein [Candidatus Dormibacteraeota bacterium]
MASKRPLQTNGRSADIGVKGRAHEALGAAGNVSLGVAGTQRLVDPGLFGDPQAAANFIRSVLEASTEYSIMSQDLDGNIQLWNEGARRLYGYEPGDVIGKANSSILHTAEDVATGLPQQMMATALDTGKFEGTIVRRRKNRTTFTARVVLTPRRDNTGHAVGFLLISKDVSDEIRLNQELEATQVYTRSLIESNVDAIMTTDPLGVITDVNQQMEALTGHSREELIGSRFNRYFTDHRRADDGIRLVLREGKVTNYELTARSKSGHETLVSYNATAFFDRDRKLQGVFAAARDITEQKKLEEQLREQQNYLRGLIESSVDGLLTVDSEGLISDVNEQMCRLSGYAREDLLGTGFANYFVEPDRANAGVKETFDQGTVKDYVLTLLTRLGKRLQVSFNASIFRDHVGNVRGIFASARDITDEAGLQAQLVSERAYNRGLIEASFDGLITVDPMLTITDVNEKMCQMSGYDRTELIGSTFQEYFTDAKRAAAGVRLTLDKGVITNYEITLRTKDGQEQLVSFNAATFTDEAGKVRGIFASARDITDQARLQKQLAEEQAYNRGLIEASRDGLVTVNDDLRITDVNETLCQLVGRPRAQLVGSMFPEYFTERERAIDGVRLTFQKGVVTNYVLTMQAANGQELPVSFNAAVFRDAAGVVRGIFASFRDITDQQELEHQLRDTQSYTRSLIESNIDALMTTDPLGVITDVNEQMVALTGHTREDLIGSVFKTYFTEPDRAEEGIRLVLTEGKVTNYELTARSKEGRETVVSYNARAFYDRENHLKGVFAAARTITEQRKLEEQLREQQAYLRGLIESSGDGLITVDPDGFISDVNDQMCRMSGYGRADLNGTQFADYFTEREVARAGVNQTFEMGVVTEYALTLVSRTRRHLQVTFNASVFKDSGGIARGIFASVRDVTDRVRLEEQMREQQTYLRGLIESSGDGLVTVDPEGFITDLNEQMCRMTGYSRQELMGSVFKRYFTQPDNAELGVRRTLAEGGVTNYELVLEAKGARKAAVSFNASVFRAPDGHIEGIFASMRDISEKARLETQLTEQQVYNRSLFEASADALFAIAPDGVITDVNEEATRLSGYSRKHLISSHFNDYFTDPAQAGVGVAKTFAKGRVIGYELVIVTRQSRQIPVSFNAGVFADAAGKALGILAGAREVSAQKQLEQQLRDSQVYTRSLIESNIDALVTTDPVGVITDVNQQMEALTGLGRNELIGSDLKKYFTEPERAEEGVRQTLREGKVTDFELSARSRSGEETVVVYNAATLFDPDQKLQGIFAAVREITERKRFERQLQETNLQLERADQAKDRFLASMSHELRTPLNAIIGFTGTLLMKLPGPLNSEQEEQLQTVQSSGRHLLSIINDLLDLAKIESGKWEGDFQPLDCAELAREVAGGLSPLARNKGLSFSVTAPEQVLTASVDRRALTQILINLSNNAIKFTDTGQVRLEVHESASNGHATVRFDVIDTGIGIKQEDQAKLFEAFEQLKKHGTAPREGTGLGLYICQRLAGLLGGSIEFTSEFGAGSAFSFIVPRDHREQ